MVPRPAALVAVLTSLLVAGAAVSTVVGAAPASAATPSARTATQQHATSDSTGYTSRGTPVSGADQLSEQAPLLKPGQYLDRYANGSAQEGGSAVPGSTKFYTVPIQTNADLYVSATMINPPGARADTGTTLGVGIKLRARDNYSCAETAQRESQSDTSPTIATAVLSAAPGRSPWSDRCPTSGVGIIEVQRTGTAYRSTPASVELVVRYEPLADTTGLGPGFDRDQPVLAKPTFGSSNPVTPGSSFNDAVAVASGVTYETTITTGQSQYYRIPLRWGQRFTYLIEQVDRGPGAPDTGAYVRPRFSDPLRHRVDTTDSTFRATWFSKTESEPLTGSSIVPTRYTNRTGSVGYEFDGDYFLSLAADSPQTALTTRYRLLVVISGTPEAGPRYETQLEGSATPGPSSSSSSSGTGNPDTVATSQPDAASGNTTTLTIALAIVAALGGAGLTVLVAQLRSRRASRQAQGPQT